MLLIILKIVTFVNHLSNIGATPNRSYSSLIRIDWINITFGEIIQISSLENVDAKDISYELFVWSIVT